MSEFAIILPEAGTPEGQRLFEMLLLQKYKDIQVYVPAAVFSSLGEVDDRLTVRPYEGEPLKTFFPAETWTLLLKSDISLGPKAFSRMHDSMENHPGYDVFHWNLQKDLPQFPHKLSAGRFFKETAVKETPAPLSSFLFRTDVLQTRIAADPDIAAMPAALILSCAGEAGIRTVRHERCTWQAPSPEAREENIRARLAYFHWTERHFGSDYPLDTGDRLALFAATVVRLYPDSTPDQLKEEMMSFSVSSGPIRKMRANSALKGALQRRIEALK